MNRELARNITLFVQLLALGPAIGSLMTMVRDVDGGHAASPLVSATPVTGVLVLLAVVVLAGVIGWVDARFFGPRSGLAGAGIILAWAGLRVGETEDMLRIVPAGWAMTRLAIEGVIVGVAVVFMVSRIGRLPTPHDFDNTNSPEHSHGSDGRSGSNDHGPGGSMSGSVKPTGEHSGHGSFNPMALLRPMSLVGAVASAAAGGFIAWIVAFHGDRAQTIFASYVGAIAAGAAAAISASMAQTKDEGRSSDVGAGAVDPMLVCAAAALVLAIAAPLITLGIHGSGDVALAESFRGRLFRLAHIGPLDWAAGMLMGASVGLSWAGVHAHVVSQGTTPRPASA